MNIRGLHAKMVTSIVLLSTALAPLAQARQAATSQNVMPVFAAPKKTVENTNWKDLFHQLLFWNVQKNMDMREIDMIVDGAVKTAQENKKPPVDAEKLRRELIQNVYKRSFYYNDMNFNDAFKAMDDYSLVKRMKDGKTVSERDSDRAYMSKEEILGFSSKSAKFWQSQNLDGIVGTQVQSNADVSEFAQLIASQKNRSIFGVNYFETKVGQSVIKNMGDVLVVVLPGFGSHTIADYSFAELVEEANEYYGRPTKREIIKHTSSTVEAEYKNQVRSSLQSYYGSKSTHQLTFDVVSPTGYELGNSMGKDEDEAKALGEWLRMLPSEYAHKKIIFVGYSKGTPIAHNTVTHPNNGDIRSRTMTILTMAGVAQGAVPAQEGFRPVMKQVGAKTPKEAVAIIKGMFDTAKTKAAALVMNIMAAWVGMKGVADNKWEALAGFADSLTVLAGKSPKVQGIMDQVADLEPALDGIADMTNYERVKWNLLNMNDEKFGKPEDPITVMNLSVLTDKGDFLTPGLISPWIARLPPLIFPNVDPRTGLVNNVRFSRDNLFLDMTSIQGFQQSRLGLFDTQVAWLDTKSLALDRRPLLNETLTNEEVEQLALDLQAQGKNVSAQDLKTKPRNQILAMINGSVSGIRYVDLGEVRGTHWDISFRQVYKPAGANPQTPPARGTYYEHDFPRKACLSALMETLTLYKLANQGGAK